MTKIINLTPENFVDLFILCLSWQWEPVSLAHTWTTVDKVMKILLGLGVISEPQVALLRSPRHGREYQRHLRRHIELLYGASADDGQGKNKPGELTERARAVLSQRQFLCVGMTDLNQTLNLVRLVRDQHIHLTYLGAAYADGLAEQFAPWVTRTTFKAEEARREALFRNEAAHAAAAEAYRREVEGEDKPQSIRKGQKKKGTGPAVNLTRLW